VTAAQSESAVYGGDRDGAALQAAFAAGEIPVAVYGLGKMGLPLAAVLADVTGNVVGVDVDESVVEAVTAGESPVEGEPGLTDLVAATSADGSLSATTRSERAAATARVHVVIVPTLIEETEPDLSMLLAAVDATGEGLDAGDLVIIESTVPPGTTRDVVTPRLAERSGLDPGDFGVAFCPERTASGRAIEDIRGAYPKVVGGADSESERVAGLLYDELTSNEVIHAGDATTAECVKVFEGIYRDVNIALANELAGVAEPLDVDVRRAIEVANTQPFCEIHDPGPGVGGHCIPLYPHFLTATVDRELPVVETSRAVNDEMPAFVTDAVVDMLGDRGVAIEDATVLVLGVAYRAGVDETRKSPTRPVVAGLDALGADVRAADPAVDVRSVPDFPAGACSIADVEATADRYDAVVVMTEHDAYAELDFAAFGDAVVVDARDALGELPLPTYTVGVGET
jgi:UDP-N-acetyl-D-mannosaminuronic acid dehydrogenase